MDFLKEALNEKKNEIKKLKGDQPKKYYKKAELEKERERIYLLEHEEQNKKKRKFENDEILEKEKKKKKEIEEELNMEIPLKEDVQKLLRELNEPISLFGETEKERWKRLQECNQKKKEHSGYENELLKSMKQVEESSLKKEGKKEIFDFSIQKYDLFDEETESKESFTLKTLKRLLFEWEIYLGQRSEKEKKSGIHFI
jgi:hypothetical protein